MQCLRHDILPEQSCLEFILRTSPGANIIQARLANALIIVVAAPFSVAFHAVTSGRRGHTTSVNLGASKRHTQTQAYGRDF